MLLIKHFTKTITGIITCCIISCAYLALGPAPAHADTSTQNLININSYEHTVLLQHFTEAEILALDSMTTANEVDRIVALIDNPYSALDQIHPLLSQAIHLLQTGAPMDVRLRQTGLVEHTLPPLATGMMLATPVSAE